MLSFFLDPNKYSLYHHQGIEVNMVIVGDDVALASDDSTAGARSVTDEM